MSSVATDEKKTRRSRRKERDTLKFGPFVSRGLELIYLFSYFLQSHELGYIFLGSFVLS
jgi:hypothetical protein